jgi:hypothetical protein
MNLFGDWPDDHLDALAPAIDTFVDDVVEKREPHLTIVHEYNVEVIARKNRNLLAERGVDIRR